ncbi:methyltransferase domain-containing protein [Botrytis cinerea]
MAAVKVDSQQRYHDTSAAYVLPKANDVIEQDRLDTQAAAIVEMIGGFPLLAPLQTLNNISKVVDIGCGTGVATIQIATILPSATIYGLDLTPVPEDSRRMAPGNVVWAQENVLDVDYNQPDGGILSREIFKPGELDYVFGRMLFLGISNWPKYFSTTSHALRSGGIIEHQDLDWKFYRVGTSECVSDDWEWHKAILSGAQKSGLSATSGSGAAALMTDCNLEVINVQSFEFSFSASSRTPKSQAMARYVQAKLIPQYPELLRKMLGAIGISGEKLETLTRACLHDINSEEGLYQKYTVTIARKA